MERNVLYAYRLNGIHLIWQYLRDSPNRQIKATTKYMYHVYSIQYGSLSLGEQTITSTTYELYNHSGKQIRVAIEEQPGFSEETGETALGTPMGQG